MSFNLLAFLLPNNNNIKLNVKFGQTHGTFTRVCSVLIDHMKIKNNKTQTSKAQTRQKQV